MLAGASLTEQLPRSIVEKIPHGIPLIGCTFRAFLTILNDARWNAERSISRMERFDYAYLSAQLYRTNAVDGQLVALE